ncbi:MAG: hypothetical protein ACKVS8_13185 [Phycisphaerales bacterium]
MLARLYFEYKKRRSVQRWNRRGRPVPVPSAVKRDILLDYARRFNLRSFVETGTLKGDTVFALRHAFDQLWTVEIEPRLVARAQARFAGDPGVRCLEGDSAVVLPGIVRSLTQPTLFWLDGHYMGPGAGDPTNPCPISTELECVLAVREHAHVILIDDARLFTGADNYPPLDTLRQTIAAQRPDLEWSVEQDIIRLVPGARGAAGGMATGKATSGI